MLKLIPFLTIVSNIHCKNKKLVMKNLFKLGFLSISIAFLFTACEEDPIGGGPGSGPGTNEGDPTLAFVEEAGFISSAATVEAGQTFNVKLTAMKGDADLTGVIFSEDGLNLPDAANRITVDGGTLSDNTAGTNDDEKASFTWDVAIIAHTDVATRTYGFILNDANQNKSTIELVITTTQNHVDATVTSVGTMNFDDILPGNKACFRFDVTAGNPALNRIAVFEFDAMGDALLITDPSRLSFGDDASSAVDFVENPLVLEGDDKQGFNKVICIRSRDEESLQSYVVAFEDEADSLFQQAVSINTNPTGLPVTTFEGVLWNQAGSDTSSGMEVRGGIDLDSGSPTGSSNSDAELRDLGIDTDQPVSSNWIQRIAGVNGTEVKQLIPNENGLLESFSFESITRDIQISEIWGNGEEFTIDNSGDRISNVVTIGDMYIALRDGKYYLLKITDIIKTTDNNDDKYELDIKF